MCLTINHRIIGYSCTSCIFQHNYCSNSTFGLIVKPFNYFFLFIPKKRTDFKIRIIYSIIESNNQFLGEDGQLANHFVSLLVVIVEKNQGQVCAPCHSSHFSFDSVVSLAGYANQILEFFL